jgi:hypothetical protein
MSREKSTVGAADKLKTAISGRKTKMPATIVQRLTPPIAITLAATKRLGAVWSLKNG